MPSLLNANCAHECLAAGADRHHIGRFMGGQGHADEGRAPQGIAA